MTKRVRVIVALAAIFGIVQLLPFGESHSNPPTTTVLTWPDTATRTLFFRACGDCHSHNTSWPWYSWVAPASWTVTGHVRHGRSTLNVSAWVSEERGGEAHLTIKSLRDSSMPPADYLRWHPDARLTSHEREQLIQGLSRMPEFAPRP